MNGTVPAVILARVSTDDQAEDGYGLPRQIEACLNYIEQRGYTLQTSIGYASDCIAYIPGVFQEDYTGKVALRPAITHLLEAIKATSVKVIVIHRTSRLGRRGSVQEVLEAEFRARGVRIEFVTAQFDTATPTGRAMRRISGVFDELDYENIIEQLKEGKVQKVKNGSVLAPRPPYGYQFVKVKVEGGKTGTQLEIYEEEAQYVRLIFAWYSYGDENGNRLSIKEIARRLTKMGVPTRGVNKNAFVGYWSTTNIYDFLHNETYIGTWYYQKTKYSRDPETNKGRQVKRPRSDWLKVAVPPIVSEAVFQLASERAIHNLEQAKRNRKRTYLFSGMMRCLTCGQRFAGLTLKRTTIKRYRCGLRTRQIPPCNCPEWDYNEVDIDRVVWEWLSDIVAHPEKVEETLRLRQSEAKSQHNQLRNHLGTIEDIITQKKTEQSNLIRLYARNPLPTLEVEIDQFYREIADHEQEQARITAQLAKVAYTPAHITDIKEVCACIARGLAVFTPEEKRQTYEMLELSLKLTIEEGWQVAYAECIIDLEEKRLPIEPCDIAFGSSQLAGLRARSPFLPTSS